MSNPPYGQPLHRLVRRGQINVALYDGEKTIQAGTPVEVARFCCDSPVGNAGVVHGWRNTPRGTKVVVDYGRNAGGQRLLKPYPANVLRVASNASPQQHLPHPNPLPTMTVTVYTSSYASTTGKLHHGAIAWDKYSPAKLTATLSPHTSESEVGHPVWSGKSDYSRAGVEKLITKLNGQADKLGLTFLSGGETKYAVKDPALLADAAEPVARPTRMRL